MSTKMIEYKPQRKLAGYYYLRDKPHLVQRVEWMDPPRDRGGVDRYFGFSYMGSSEFEWGSLPSALKYMREDVAKWDENLPVEMRVRDHVAWYVGPPEGLAVAEALFAWQLDEKRRYVHKDWYLKERTEIRDAYIPSGQWECKVIGWWAIDAAPCPWAFFMEKAHAEQWLKCLRTPKEESV